MGYASRLEHGPTAVPEIPGSDHSATSSNHGQSLLMGWVLKSSRARSTRFSTKQDYLKAKFQIGERFGQKVDPTSVSKAMRTAKDANGLRLFDSKDFLTAQQISSFFSRLAAKRSIEDDGQIEDDDDEVIQFEQERQLQQLRNKAITTVSIQHSHPVV